MKKLVFILVIMFGFSAHSQNPALHRQGVVLGSFSSDPTGVSEGQLYWNDVSLRFKQYNGSVWGFLVPIVLTEDFEEDNGTPTVHALTQTAISGYGAIVSLNGSVLKLEDYTLTTTTLTIGVPILQYDEIIISYFY